jgi:hypothetical protein
MISITEAKSCPGNKHKEVFDGICTFCLKILERDEISQCRTFGVIPNSRMVMHHEVGEERA